MSQFWKLPRTWLNATLDWLANTLYSSSSQSWLRALVEPKSTRLNQSQKSKESHRTDSSESNQLKSQALKEKTQQNDQLEQQETEQKTEHELEFLNQFTEFFPGLGLTTSSAFPQDSEPQTHDHEQNLPSFNEANEAEIHPEHKSYAEQLLLSDQDWTNDYDLNSDDSLHDHEQSLEAMIPAKDGLNQIIRPAQPQGITRVKLYDEEREKRRSARRKRRLRRERKRKKERQKTMSSSRMTSSQSLSDEQAIHHSASPNESKQPHDDSKERANTKALNTWRRPPLRSLSKWERMGQAQMSQWQRYSPSSKALLFGSWFASLESLVNVDREMKQEREQFYQLVEGHEELSSFSPTELDAWWFQLNRVDYFITEYQFYKKLERQSDKHNTQLVHQSISKEVAQEQAIPSKLRIDENEAEKTLAEYPTQDLPQVQTFEPIFEPSLNSDSHLPQYIEDHEGLYTNDHRDSGLRRNTLDRSQSIDRSLITSNSLDEDFILRPIKKRKRRRKPL